MDLNIAKNSLNKTFKNAKNSLAQVNLEDTKSTLKKTKLRLTTELNRTYKDFKRNYLSQLFEDGKKHKVVHPVAHTIKWKAKNH